MGSIQVSVGQPQWLGPEKGNNGGFKSCWSQAHHGCRPDPLHVWLPIAAILLLPPLLLRLYMVVFSITATQKERKRDGGGTNSEDEFGGGERSRLRESTGMSVAFLGQE